MSAPSIPAGTAAGPLTIRPWPDDVIDSLGHDPRSHYVETYWLGILGPVTYLFLRKPPQRGAVMAETAPRRHAQPAGVSASQ